MPKDYPSRIVCLSAEAVEILYRLGCGERIVGVTGFALEPPEARRKPRVSGFSNVHYAKIDALEPDLDHDIKEPKSKKANQTAHLRWLRGILLGHTVSSPPL